MAKKPTQGATPPARERTPDDQAALEALVERRKARTFSPRLKIGDVKGVTQIGVDHPDAAMGMALMMQAMGATEPDFFDGLLSHLVNAGIQGRDDARGVHFMVAAIKAAAPRDELETMLAAQMAAVHMATMTFARRLAHVENIAQQDSAARGFAKLARTYAAQLEALKRYRTGGEQTVTVQHVTVQDGGQAIVGAVSTGGRGCSAKAEETP